MKLDFQLTNNRGNSASSSRTTNITETQNIKPAPSTTLITIVPSAQSTNTNVRIVPSAFNIASNSHEFPTLNSQQQSQNSTVSNWKVYLILC